MSIASDPLGEDITESEAAMLDAVRTLYDLLIAKRVIKPKRADDLLRLRQERYAKEDKLRAAGILGLLRALSTSEDVQKNRETALKLRMAQPKGSA